MDLAGTVLAVAIPSGLVYWSISSIIEVKTASSGCVTMRPIEVVSRSAGNSFVVSIGPSATNLIRAKLDTVQWRLKDTSEKVPGTRMMNEIH